MMGIRREWGGSIVFFGLTENSEMGMNPSNAIDAHDTGREIQVGPNGLCVLFRDWSKIWCHITCSSGPSAPISLFRPFGRLPSMTPTELSKAAPLM